MDTQQAEEKPLTIQETKNLVMEMLGPVHANEFIFRAGVIMLAVLRVGPRPEKIAEFTGYSLTRTIIPRVLDRMVQVGILNKERNALKVEWLRDSPEQSNSEEQTVAFVMDCMAIAGHFTRSENEKGELLYQMTDKAINVVKELPNEAKV